MLHLLGSVRSLVAFVLLLLDLAFWGLVQRFLLWPAMSVAREGRGLLALYMKSTSASLLAIIRLGGGRVRRSGTIPTDRPVLIVMNHQSLLDIPTVILMQEPRIAWFVTRRRYLYAPVVGLCLRLLKAPIIEPGNRAAALRAIQTAAREQETGLLIFPEGHRTPDGGIQAFHSAGLLAILRERPVPVYVVVTDGFWTCRRLVDFLFNIHRIDGRTEVLGPFDPPLDGSVPEFVEELRRRMVEHLAAMRRGTGKSAAA